MGIINAETWTKRQGCSQCCKRGVVRCRPWEIGGPMILQGGIWVEPWRMGMITRRAGKSLGEWQDSLAEARARGEVQDGRTQWKVEEWEAATLNPGECGDEVQCWGQSPGQSSHRVKEFGFCSRSMEGEGRYSKRREKEAEVSFKRWQWQPYGPKEKGASERHTEAREVGNDKQLLETEWV